MVIGRTVVSEANGIILIYYRSAIKPNRDFKQSLCAPIRSICVPCLIARGVPNLTKCSSLA